MKRTVAAIIASVLFSCLLQGQGLPALEKDKGIVTGQLPDGISYYLVKNTSLPGFADFALVQPVRTDVAGPRQDLASLPHFESTKPYGFLARSGVGYGPRGYIRHTGGATVFRFSDVPVSQTATADSTLLLLFDLARTSPYAQAIAISGDIDVSAISERLRILSMTISQRLPADDILQYGWRVQEEAAVTTGTGPVGLVRVIYRSPRTDPELMNTIQPVMSRQLAREMDIILSRRLRAAFSAAGIPLADYRFRYTGSDMTSGDETVSISVETSPEKLEAATRTLAGVLGTLDRRGTTTEEVSFARSLITEQALREDDIYHPGNSDWLDKCISNYLYGANLASHATLSKTFTGRRLDAERERELLDRYISALLDPGRNLHIHSAAPVKPDPDSVRAAFTPGWNDNILTPADIPQQSDTLTFPLPRKKVKVSNTSAESFSGGKMWTFSNGATVIYKKTSDKGAFRFGYTVKGGWTEVPGIKGGEGSFVSDAIGLEKVAGMSGERFRDLLLMNGITLEGMATLTDVRWTGSAPSDRLSLVLKAILALSGRSAPDPDAYSRYCTEKAIRLQRDRYASEGTRAIIDSTMCPGYSFSSGSMPAIPGPDFPGRVDTYLGNQGAAVRNSLIVLIGDLDEAQVQKLLAHILSGFGNSRQRSVRPRMSYPLRECWSTMYAPGNWRDRGVTVGISALWPFSSGSNTGLSLACTVLEHELACALAPKGYSYRVTADATILPSETISIYVNCRPVPAAGLPGDVTPAPPKEALDAVRTVLHRLATQDIAPDVLAASKTSLLNRMQASAGDSGSMLNSLIWRNSVGRDVTGSYKERIKAIKASDVRAMFAAMEECNCEFVVQ